MARKQGIEEGIKEGIKQGKEEGIQQEKEDMIKSLYKLDVPLESISKASKLTLKEVKDILNIK